MDRAMPLGYVPAMPRSRLQPSLIALNAPGLIALNGPRPIYPAEVNIKQPRVHKAPGTQTSDLHNHCLISS